MQVIENILKRIKKLISLTNYDDYHIESKLILRYLPLQYNADVLALFTVYAGVLFRSQRDDNRTSCLTSPLQDCTKISNK